MICVRFSFNATAPQPARWRPRTAWCCGKSVTPSRRLYVFGLLAVSFHGSLVLITNETTGFVHEGHVEMTTYSPKASEITRSWHVIDAENLVLGRLCTEVARLLRGKHKPVFAPHIDTGDRSHHQCQQGRYQGAKATRVCTATVDTQAKTETQPVRRYAGIQRCAECDRDAQSR